MLNNCDVCGSRLEYSVVCPNCGFDNSYQFDEEENPVTEAIEYYDVYIDYFIEEDILYDVIYEIFGIPRTIVNEAICCDKK